MLSPVLIAAAGLTMTFVLTVPPAHAAMNANPLSPDAQALVDRAFYDLEGQELVDYHVHILGLGSGGTGATVDPALLGWQHPLARLKALVFFKSSGISEESQADRQYVERLLQLAQDFRQPSKLAILAFDHHRDRQGQPIPDKSEFHTPNDYVLDLAGRWPDRLIPVVSVHPYDPDALEKLESSARVGARIVKWLPNAQGMDPSDPAIDDFYRAMIRHDMTLLCHTGYEASVKSRGSQHLGNPLLLRRPLDMGVRVIMAHVGNRGSSDDLDHPGRKARNFDLALRLMDEPKYKDHLFADISALTQAMRNTKDIARLIERQDLHSRLVNGSDYPLPAIDVFIQPLLLQAAGFITDRERRQLSEIYKRNPLLFDFVLKRTLRHPETKEGFNAGIFAANPAIAVTGQSMPTSLPTGEK